MADTYAIIEDGQPVDGEFMDKGTLFRTLIHADYDARIMALDLAEFISDGATSARDVTEDMTVEWWDHGGLADTYERIAAGGVVPGLASRFYSDECAAYDMRVAS